MSETQKTPTQELDGSSINLELQNSLTERLQRLTEETQKNVRGVIDLQLTQNPPSVELHEYAKYVESTLLSELFRSTQYWVNNLQKVIRNEEVQK